jgi:transcriptional regulator with XRE-family HTH domain
MLTIVSAGLPVQVTSPADFGAAFRQRRRERSLTQLQVAAAAGVGRGVLQKLESARGTVTVDSMLRIATALSLDVVIRPRQIGVPPPDLA